MTFRNCSHKGSADWNDCKHDFTVIICKTEMVHCDGFIYIYSWLLKLLLWLDSRTILLYIPYYIYIWLSTRAVLSYLWGGSVWYLLPAFLCYTLTEQDLLPAAHACINLPRNIRWMQRGVVLVQSMFAILIWVNKENTQPTHTHTHTHKRYSARVLIEIKWVLFMQQN